VIEERSLPKPPKSGPKVANPSTPGVQKPPNKPDGRSAPFRGETRLGSADGVERRVRSA
jgi:hypothetical protein